MAKVPRLPALAIIDGFKGTLDFYLWKGIICVRSWPRSPGKKRSPLVEAQWPAFTIASRLWNELPLEERDNFNRLASNSGLSGRDLAQRAYLKGILPKPLP